MKFISSKTLTKKL